MTNLRNSCPCCSMKEYGDCCKPFHEGALPKNALELMRSRYSAYVLNMPDYIVATTHPSNREYSENKFSWKRSISQFSKHSSFQKLHVLDFQERGNVATVTFTVYLLQNNQDVTFTERSCFEKIKNQWLYRGGELAQGYVPSLVKKGPLKLLPLAYYGDPVLTKKAEPVSEITSDLIKLVEEMVETMDAFDGMGLAAPQIHRSLRLFVIRPPVEVDKDTIELGEVKVLINPKLSLPSEEKWIAPEGCLSIPTVRGFVDRPREITVEYTSLDGKVIIEKVSGWEARVIMHENDHIDGILFMDRLDPKERSKLLPSLQKLEKRMHDDKDSH